MWKITKLKDGEPDKYLGDLPVRWFAEHVDLEQKKRLAMTTTETFNSDYSGGSCLQSRQKVSARSKHLRRLIQIMMYWMRQLFGCRHEYHAHFCGGRWRDATCKKCGAPYPTWRIP